MHHYSYAGAGMGTADPDDVYCTEVEDEDCDIQDCDDDNCHHTILMWSGNGYTRRNTWIACEDKYTVNLETEQ